MFPPMFPSPMKPSVGLSATSSPRYRAELQSAAECSAVDVERREAIAAEPALEAREVGDRAVRPVDHVDLAIEFSDPHDEALSPPASRHVLDEASDAQVVVRVVAAPQLRRALAVDAEEFADGPVARARATHEAPEQRVRLRELARREGLERHRGDSLRRCARR